MAGASPNTLAHPMHDYREKGGQAPMASCRAPLECNSPSRRNKGTYICLLALLLAFSAPAHAFTPSLCPALRGHSSSIVSTPWLRPTVLLAGLDLIQKPSVRFIPSISMAKQDLPPSTAAEVSVEIYDAAEREKVSAVIEIMMNTPKDALKPAPEGSLPPKIYIDNMKWLLNEPVYKAVMYSRLEQCGTEEELQQLEIVDELLLDIKKRQRDTWNREKLEIIIGAALEGPVLLDEVLTDMRDSRALDDGMVDFLDALTDQATLNAEPATSSKAKPKPVAVDEDEGVEGAGGVADDGEPKLLKMLRVIKDRVIAEIRTRDKPYVRMLAVLLRIDEKEERDALLRSTVLTEEAAEMFEKFTLDGIQYMEQHRADWLADERVEKMKGVAREVGDFRSKLRKMRSGSVNS